MKKTFAIALLCSLSFVAFAQETKPEVSGEASAEISSLQIAANLAKYGYQNNSATALIEAAKIFAETPVQPLDAVKTPGTEQSVSEKDSAVAFDPAQLLADARTFAGKDKVVLKYASQVEREIAKGATRGAVGGANYHEDRVLPNDYDIYRVTFRGGERAEVTVIGDGDNDLDLYIYDENDNLVASDYDYTDTCVCCWTPAWTGVFRIKIVNRGSRVYSNYIIMTN